jgi:hypothetical protein
MYLEAAKANFVLFKEQALIQFKNKNQPFNIKLKSNRLKNHP